MTKISVIIPIYNTKRFLSRSISSVLSQSFSDFELILVDDGSTDGSGDVCDLFSLRDSRIRVFHKENGGVSTARNLGLDHATGEWVYFVDSDDELLPGGLQTLVNCISDEVDIVMGGYDEVREKGASFKIDESIELFLSKKQSLVSLYWGYGSYYPYCGYLWMRLLRRRVIQEYRIVFDPTITIKEDTLFLTQFICKSNGITRQTTTPVYRYFRRSDSTMGRVESSFDRQYVDSFYALVKMKHEVEALFPYLSTPVYVAEQAIIGRYSIIEGMMNASNLDDGCLKTELSSIMHDEVFSFFVFKIRRKIRKVFNAVKKSISR